MNISPRCCLLGFLTLAALAAPTSAALTLTFEAPGVQSSNVSGITTENFDAIPLGPFTGPIAVGTLSNLSGGGGSIAVAQSIGGAGLVGRYFNSPDFRLGSTQLNLSGSQSYFGFWWSAADAGNQIRFYNGATLLGSFNAATALSSLSVSYNGNPNNGSNTAEKYAYMNVFGTGGTTFDRIEFENTSNNSGFEMDNFSVRATPVTPIGTPVDGGITPPIPEPSTWVLGALAGLGLGAVTLRRRQPRSQAVQV